MYELVNVLFPFADDAGKRKPRPGFVISPPFGRHKQVIVAYVTTRFDEILETDILLDPKEKYFSKTGLKRKSLLRLHRLSTFQTNMLKEGDGFLPPNLIPQLKNKLKIILQLE